MPDEFPGIPPYRQPPHNIEAEMAVLGAIFVNNETYGKVSGFLRPEHFSTEPHVRIFKVIAKRIESGTVADPITLKAHFEQDKTLEDIGGPVYLMKLADSAVTVINATEYGRIIHDLYQRRELIAEGERLAEQAYRSDVDNPVSKIVAEAQSGISGILDEATRTNGRLQGVWLHEVEAEASFDDVVGGLLQAGGLSVVYGEPKCGKSFFVTDMALHLALGWTWHNRTVKHGLVVYIAAEGGGGFGMRFQAFQQRHGLEQAPLPFRLIRCPINLLAPNADTGPLISEIKTAAAKVELSPVLVIVDTLSRVMVGGNENASEDMGTFVANVDRIREATGAHCCVVHHKGKDDSRGMRGSTVLRGAVDTSIDVKRNKDTGVSTAKVVDQRDRESGDEFHFTLEQVMLGTDGGGEDISSCVVVEADAPQANGQRLTDAQRLAIDALRDTIIDGGELPPASRNIPLNVRAVRRSLWRDYMEGRHISKSDKPDSRRKAMDRAEEKLQANGIIGIWQDWVWLADKSDNAGQ